MGGARPVTTKKGVTEFLPYEQLTLAYRKGRPDLLIISICDIKSINRPCCIIPQIEVAKLNLSSKQSDRQKMKYWMLEA